MLVNVSAEERGREELFNRPAQVVASTLFLALLVFGLIRATSDGVGGLNKRDQRQNENIPVEQLAAAREAEETRTLPAAETGVSRLSRETERVGGSLYRFAALPFEIASVLLLAALVGALVIARD
jgi:NADH:ubiquinone oxidoreductase subunit 6 (subunit J)